MEKRAVISEEDTPNLDRLRGQTKHAVMLDEDTRPKPGTPEYLKTMPEYQQKIAKILGSTPVKLEDLDENHPTRRLIAGAGLVKSAKPRLPKDDPRNKVR